MVLVGTLVQEEGLSRVKPSMGSVYLSSSNSPAKMAFVMFGRSPEDENTARASSCSNNVTQVHLCEGHYKCVLGGAVELMMIRRLWARKLRRGFWEKRMLEHSCVSRNCGSREGSKSAKPLERTRPEH